MKVQIFLSVMLLIKAYNSMVECTSDICSVNSSNLFRPIREQDHLSGGMVDALNLEFSMFHCKSSSLF